MKQNDYGIVIELKDFNHKCTSLLKKHIFYIMPRYFHQENVNNVHYNNNSLQWPGDLLFICTLILVSLLVFRTVKDREGLGILILRLRVL